MSERRRWPGRFLRAAWTLPAEREDDAVGLLGLYEVEGCAARRAGPRRVFLEAWFDAARPRALAEEACARLRDTGWVVREHALEEIEDPGWLEAALAPRDPLRIGAFRVLDGRREEAPLEGVVDLLLPPGRAFGTGEHATTRLCLLELEEVDVRDALVLDLGTGSALLAIAAARRGAQRVAALDIDPRVVDVAAENVRMNGVAERVPVVAGTLASLAEGERYALCFANIHKSALVRGARGIAGRLVARGAAIVSGFSPDDADDVAAAFARAGCVESARRVEDAWCAARFARGAGEGEESRC